jgi:hypothetical protein
MIGDRIETSRVEWTGRSELTAARILAAETDIGPGNEAAEFLREELAEGAVDSLALFRTAKAQGIPESTLRRAKDRLGVKAVRHGFGPGGSWFWKLPVIDAQARNGDEISAYGNPISGQRVSAIPAPIDAHSPKRAPMESPASETTFEKEGEF